MQAQGGLFNTMQQQAGISVGITIEGNKLHIKCEMLYKYTFFHTECHSIYVKLTYLPCHSRSVFTFFQMKLQVFDTKSDLAANSWLGQPAKSNSPSAL